MMTETEKLQQLERLQRVPPQEWRKVREALVRRMTDRLWFQQHRRRTPLRLWRLPAGGLWWGFGL